VNQPDKEQSLKNGEENGGGRFGRRRFLDYLLGSTAIATLGAIIYPIFRFMVPPRVVEAQQNSVVAGTAAELPVNSGKIFKFGSKPGLIVHTAPDEYKAFSATCTHLDCIVQYRGESKDIFCACHGGVYDLNGKNVSGPPPRPLDVYTVNVKGDELIVTKG
jgi:Rieske Fe-S protein